MIDGVFFGDGDGNFTIFASSSSDDDLVVIDWKAAAGHV